jgi:nitroreductase
LNQTEIITALDWRYATKVFDKTKKISDQDWSVLSQSLVKAPSSYGLQPWKFLVIQNSEIREKLRPFTWNQSQVTDCSHYVVLLTRTKLEIKDIHRHLVRIGEVRELNQEFLEPYKNLMVDKLLNSSRLPTIKYWAHRQAYIALGFLLETAALLKIDACPIEGLEPEEYDKILNLAGSGWESVASVALGYRSEKDGYQNLKKVRFEEKTVIEFVN